MLLRISLGKLSLKSNFNLCGFIVVSKNTFNNFMNWKCSKFFRIFLIEWMIWVFIASKRIAKGNQKLWQEEEWGKINSREFALSWIKRFSLLFKKQFPSIVIANDGKWLSQNLNNSCQSFCLPFCVLIALL